jgi:hypothetical protein
MIEGVLASNLAPSALLGLGLVLIFTGGLVPFRYYKAMRDDRDKALATVEKQAEQIDKLLVPMAQNTAAILRALPRLNETEKLP